MSSAAGALLGGLAGVGLARAIDSDSDDSPGVFPDGSGIAAFGTFALSVVIGAVGGLVGGAYLDEPVCSQTWRPVSCSQEVLAETWFPINQPMDSDSVGVAMAWVLSFGC
ncbi:MAG: hypothetical protein AAFQ65_06115, partial [Myxococcota bacterium]